MQQNKSVTTLKLLTILIWLVLPVSANAVQPDEVLTDKKLETRARNISAGLRCLVCQNQSIDDSDAPLARDLRILVRERLKKGDDDKAVLDFVVARYGNFILLKPPLNLQTILLWSLPALILVFAGGVLLIRIRKRRNVASPENPLNEEELAQLRGILDRK